jgi:DNA polymerase-3 subunit gamma/tau
MDVLEIDGASNNGVEHIRDLREQVKYAPMRGKYKVYIIDEVHMLSKPAFNALLKTLEEPPEHVVFIFATTEVGKVPHTILSRVQRFDFKRISETNIRGRLEHICREEKIQAETEALEAVAVKADGSMRDALSLFDRVYAFSGSEFTLESARRVLGIPSEDLFDRLFSAFADHDTSLAFSVVSEVLDQGLDLQDFLVAFGGCLRDAFFLRSEGIPASKLGLSEARAAALGEASQGFSDGDLLRFSRMLSDTLTAMKQAAHPRLAVEMALCRMATLDRLVQLEQVLAHLPGLATGQGGAPPTPAVRSTPTSMPASASTSASPLDSGLKKKNLN